MRGEYNYGGNPPTWNQGSPPLARGIHCCYEQTKHLLGITPACAGNTENVRRRQMVHQDHPRLRGEYCIRMVPMPGQQGSPPLARGIPGCTESLLCSNGITPACAGNTSILIPRSHLSRDHPRLRGEYFYGNGFTVDDLGSPPLARGIH